ncbi:putative acyltransferase 3 [Mycobacterium sp. MAC_080597_8934]|nr:putative acyltransferase 3 [Mycobacterium sp. MAC_080597_8934]
MAAAHHRHHGVGAACPAAAGDAAPGAVRGGAGADRGGVVGRGRAVDPHLAVVGVLLAAHPGLGAGGRRPGGPVDPAVAPAVAANGVDRRLGRSGIDPADLHPAQRPYPVSRHRGAAAGAGHRADHRWRRRHRRARAGPAAVPPGDARDRPDLLFLVPVALAGAVADARAARRARGAAGPAERDGGVGRIGRAHPASGGESRPLRRRAALLGESQPGGRGRRECRHRVRMPGAAQRDTGPGGARRGRSPREHHRDAPSNVPPSARRRPRFVRPSRRPGSSSRPPPACGPSRRTWTRRWPRHPPTRPRCSSTAACGPGATSARASARPATPPRRPPWP